ncbi:hypothetical protein HNP67_001064 [Borreliella californiensis]|uniref:Uncharacterized protein n=1 Tax=Borreliella californiensis TaxID=373543 RepID=A0A7X0DPT0_9SPIR|nr:hypothetical protein [Borreliella californiensis]MBB6213569.1 hypothetical protein [Borreliella californiensis]
MKIDSLQEELNRIQNENKKREKPLKDFIKMLTYNIANKYPLINQINYRFRGEFMFNFDPKKRAISDRFKGLLSISGKVFILNNIAFANSASAPIHMGALKS